MLVTLSMAIVAVMAMGVMVRPWRILTHPSHMVMVTILWLTESHFKPWQPHAVLTEFAVHIRAAVYGFLSALLKEFDEQRMRIKIVGAEKLGIRMLGGKFSCKLPDAFFQHPGKKKKRQDHDPTESHAVATPECFWQERRRHANVARCRPAKPEAFPQEARELLHIGIGIRVATAASNHQQKGIAPVPRRCSSLRGSDLERTEFDNFGMQV